MVCEALLVCKVESTKCPVSAAVTAVEIVSGIAHFADQNHIHIFPKNFFQRNVKIFGVNPDFPLINNGFIGDIDMFNRIFNGDNIDALVHC